MEPDLKQTMYDLETAFWSAMRDRDGDAAAKLCADTVVTINAQGVCTLSTEEVRQKLEQAASTPGRFYFSDIHVTSPSPDVAVIGYQVKQEVTVEGQNKTFTAAECATWVYAVDRWLCHARCEAALEEVA